MSVVVLLQIVYEVCGYLEAGMFGADWIYECYHKTVMIFFNCYFNREAKAVLQLHPAHTHTHTVISMYETNTTKIFV